MNETKRQAMMKRNRADLVKIIDKLQRKLEASQESEAYYRSELRKVLKPKHPALKGIK